MRAEALIIIETDEAFVVAYASDPEDWVARFEKSPHFAARAWAERMALRSQAEDQSLGSASARRET